MMILMLGKERQWWGSWLLVYIETIALVASQTGADGDVLSGIVVRTFQAEGLEWRSYYYCKNKHPNVAIYTIIFLLRHLSAMTSEKLCSLIKNSTHYLSFFLSFSLSKVFKWGWKKKEDKNNLLIFSPKSLFFSNVK